MVSTTFNLLNYCPHYHGTTQLIPCGRPPVESSELPRMQSRWHEHHTARTFLMGPCGTCAPKPNKENSQVSPVPVCVYNSKFLLTAEALSHPRHQTEALRRMVDSVQVTNQKRIRDGDIFLDEYRILGKWLAMAPGSASSSPNCRAKLDTACVTLSTVIVSLYVNQWFWRRTQRFIDKSQAN